MRKKRVLLFSARKLFGDSLEQTLSRIDDVDLVGHWQVDDDALEKLPTVAPDLIIITNEGLDSESISQLTTRVLDRHPDLPIFRVTLEHNRLQILSSHFAPASSRDLIDLIHRIPID